MFNKYFFLASVVLLVTFVTFSQGQGLKCHEQQDTKIDGSDLPDHTASHADDVKACRKACADTEGCEFFTYHQDQTCALKTADASKVPETGSVSGYRNCLKPAGAGR